MPPLQSWRGLLSACGVWLGCVSPGMHVPPGAIVRAGLNTVPFGLLVLGLGAITLAVAPRRATMVIYVVVVWSIVGDLFGAMIPGPRVLERTSVFQFMALAPAETVRPMPLVIVLGVALALLAAAVRMVGRRDVQTA